MVILMWTTIINPAPPAPRTAIGTWRACSASGKKRNTMVRMVCVCVCVSIKFCFVFHPNNCQILTQCSPIYQLIPPTSCCFFSSQILAGCISQIVIVRFYFSQMVIACQLQPSSVAINLNAAEGIYVDSAW